MIAFRTLTLLVFLLIISGCTDETSQSESDRHDHVLRQQIDVMNDAKSVTQTLNRNTKSQDEQSTALTGRP